MEQVPSTPKQKPRRQDARIFSAEESAAIHAQVAEIKRKEMGKARIFPKEEIANMQADVEKQRIPEKTQEEKEAEAKRTRVTHFLSDQIKSLRMDIQIANNRLSQMKRSPLLDRIVPGVPARVRGSAQDIDALENTVITLRQESDALTNTLHAFEQHQPLPADAITTLHAIEGRIASELSRRYEINQRDPSSTVSLEDPKRKLKLLNDVLRDLGA